MDPMWHSMDPMWHSMDPMWHSNVDFSFYMAKNDMFERHQSFQLCKMIFHAYGEIHLFHLFHDVPRDGASACTQGSPRDDPRFDLSPGI